MNLEQYPFDHSGSGPTGSGGGPSSRDIRKEQMNRFRMQQQYANVQIEDPWVRAAVERLVKIRQGEGNDPDAVRRDIYNTPGGQAMRDHAFSKRRSGALGQGDPVQFASEIAKGVSGGGFGVRFTGTDNDGNNVIGSGRAGGQGALSERVAGSFQQAMLRNLYGDGLPTRDKMYGFDMAETAGIFNKLASRGVVGNIATVKRNAPLAERIAAERDSTKDDDIKAMLEGISLPGSNEEDNLEALARIKDSLTDKKQQRVLDSLMKSTDAVVLDKKAERKITDLVDSVAAGMGSLVDIYGDLTAPELQDKLEQISGTRITNIGQARRAQQMVSEMRGAAKVANVDPTAYAEYVAENQARLRGDVAEALGLDARSNTAISAISAEAGREMSNESFISSKLANETVMRARELGIEVSDAPQADEIYEDKRQALKEFMTDYKAVAMAKGGVNRFSGEQKTRVEGLLKEFDATASITDAVEQERARYQIKSQLEGEYGELMGGDFSNAEAARWAAGDAAKGLSELRDDITGGRQTAINLEPMVKRLEAMGISGGADVAASMRDKIGSKSMVNLVGNARDAGLSGADRLTAQKNLLKEAELSEEESAAFMENFFDAEGKLKDEANFSQLAGQLSDSEYEGDNSISNKKRVARESIKGMGSEDNRKRLADKSGVVSMDSILTHLLTSEGASITDPESLSLTLQTMADEGIAMPSFDQKDADGNVIGTKSAEESYAAGINFSEGLNTEGLEKLRKLNGGVLDLHTKMGYDDEAAMIAATESDPRELDKALKMLKTDDAFTGFNVEGDVTNMSAVTSEALVGLKKKGLTDYLKKVGASKMLNQAVAGNDDQTATLTADGDFDSALFEADEFDKVKGKGLAPGAPRVEMGEGLGRILKMAEVVNASSGGATDAFRSLDENGGMTGAYEKQLEQLELAKAAGGKKGGEIMAEFLGPGGDPGSKTIDDAIKMLRDAIDKLAGKEEEKSAGGGLGSLEEMTVKLLRVEIMEPPK